MPRPKAFSQYANRFFYPAFQQLHLLFPANFLLETTKDENNTDSIVKTTARLLVQILTNENR